MLPYGCNGVFTGFTTKHVSLKFMVTVIITTLLKTLSVVFMKQASILSKNVRATYPSVQQPVLCPTGTESL